jgi:hypothetical protein
MEVYERDRTRQKLRDAQEYHVVLLLDYISKMVQCTGTIYQDKIVVLNWCVAGV